MPSNISVEEEDQQEQEEVEEQEDVEDSGSRFDRVEEFFSGSDSHPQPSRYYSNHGNHHNSNEDLGVREVQEMLRRVTYGPLLWPVVALSSSLLERLTPSHSHPLPAAAHHSPDSSPSSAASSSFLLSPPTSSHPTNKPPKIRSLTHSTSSSTSSEAVEDYPGFYDEQEAAAYYRSSPSTQRSLRKVLSSSHSSAANTAATSLHTTNSPSSHGDHSPPVRKSLVPAHSDPHSPRGDRDMLEPHGLGLSHYIHRQQLSRSEHTAFEQGRWVGGGVPARNRGRSFDVLRTDRSVTSLEEEDSHNDGGRKTALV